MLLDKIILTCQLQIGQARSTNSVYHILQGKPSIQTIQDIHLFKLENYYGIYKKLYKSDYSLITEYLIAQGFLLYDPKGDTYKVTNTGEKHLANTSKPLYFNGYQYKQIDDVFLQRLLLIIQVWTNSKKTHFKFIPIVENYSVEQWIKRYYYKTKDNLETSLEQLYKELTIILNDTHKRYAEIFVDQLSGYEHIGLTMGQLSNKYDYSIHDIYLINRHIVHIILQKVLSNSNDFTMLMSLIDNLLTDKKLTDSTTQTLHLLNQNKSLEQIAHIRRLRINTIYDHIVEIALNDDEFSISNYVPIKIEFEIMNAIEKLESYRLKEIKDAINPQITYFQIRLVLTKLDQSIS